MILLCKLRGFKVNEENLSENLQIITKIINKHIGNKNIQITPQTSAKDINGWDSLAHMSIILEVEKFFAIRFRASEVAKITCVGDLLKTIEVKKEK